jgi:hypothetical protein
VEFSHLQNASQRVFPWTVFASITLTFPDFLGFALSETSPVCRILGTLVSPVGPSPIADVRWLILAKSCSSPNLETNETFEIQCDLNGIDSKVE